MITANLPARIFVKCVGYYSFWPEWQRYVTETPHSWAQLTVERAAALLASGEAEVAAS